MQFLYSEFLAEFQSRVCVLKKRPNPYKDSTFDWSLRGHEICLCHALIAYDTIYDHICAKNGEDKDKVWFMDDLRATRQLLLRRNWNKDTLDKLLNRKGYCGENTALNMKF